MKKGKIRIAAVMLTAAILGGPTCLPTHAAEPEEYVVIVEECSPLGAFAEKQKELPGYVLSQQHTEADPIAWKPFYITLTALTVIGGGTIHVLVTRHRKQDHNIGKRGL